MSVDRTELMKLLLAQPTFGPWLRKAQLIELTETQTELVVIMSRDDRQIPIPRDLLKIRAHIYEFLLQHAYDLAVTIQ